MRFMGFAGVGMCLLATPAAAAEYVFSMNGVIDRFAVFDTSINRLNETPNTYLKVGDRFNLTVSFSTNAPPTSLYDADPSINIYYPVLRSLSITAGAFTSFADTASGTLQLWNNYNSSTPTVDYFGLSGGYYIPLGTSPIDFGSNATFMAFNFGAFDRTGQARQTDLIEEMPGIDKYQTSSSNMSGGWGFVSNGANRNIVVGIEGLSASLLPISAVPEPTSWTMMLVGFGMVGAIARYRRRPVKVSYA